MCASIWTVHFSIYGWTFKSDMRNVRKRYRTKASSRKRPQKCNVSRWVAASRAYRRYDREYYDIRKHFHRQLEAKGSSSASKRRTCVGIATTYDDSETKLGNDPPCAPRKCRPWHEWWPILQRGLRVLSRIPHSQNEATLLCKQMQAER